MITIPQQPLPAVRVCMRSPRACLPPCLLLAAPPPPPVAPCRPHGQWERHGKAGDCRRLRIVLPLLGPQRAGAGGSEAAGNANSPCNPTAGAGGDKFQPTNLAYCRCLGGEERACGGRTDPSPLCWVGDGRRSEELRGRQRCQPGGCGTPLPPPGCGRLSKFRSTVTAEQVSFAAPPPPLWIWCIFCWCVWFLVFFFLSFYPNYLLEFYHPMFSKDWPGLQFAGPKMSACITEWGVLLSEQLQKQVSVLGHLQSWQGFSLAYRSLSKVVLCPCIRASILGHNKGRICRRWPLDNLVKCRFKMVRNLF
ncbi:uncharacterized protein LOC129784138 [Falco peregrinus]|uniref:uncharacterized protein LOC129784138 n=1 Tax=Falco peregrinus TaxID=8954 RepID=UPI0024788A3C|nr:uncharacterized protein LOC129784138 [Falco peregrinus]